MIIGSHVSLSAPNYFVCAVEEMLSYQANAMMIYTGAPQNTIRKSIDDLKIKEGQQLLIQAGIPLHHVIVHAPYIINLANTLNTSTFELAVDFLGKEISRTASFGANILVLHPGSHVKAGEEVGIEKIIEGLNIVNQSNDNVFITLETMAGKGTEIGYRFEQLAKIKSSVNHPERIRFCLDTCHISDAGYNVFDFDEVLNQFDAILGLENLAVIHLNDSKNEPGARKDRHENIGYGQLGFDLMVKIVHHPRLTAVAKILETPYVEGVPPYKQEIAMLKLKEFSEWK